MFNNIKIKRQPLGIMLIKKGIANQEDVDKALEYQKDHINLKLGEIMDILNLCDKDALLETISEQLDEKAVMLNNGVSVDYTKYLPRDVVIGNMAIPFGVTNNTVKVAFADPANNMIVNSVEMLLLNQGYKMEKYVTLYSCIKKIVEGVKNTSDNKKIYKGEEDTTILVDNIIKTAIDKRASDIHIEPMEDKLRIRYRIDGELITMVELPNERKQILTGRLKSVSNMHQEKTDDQDGRINNYPGYNIRVSSQKNVYGEKFVLRLLKENSTVRNMFDLGFPNDNELVERAFNKRNSLIIVCAPTGEGKTTTLYSILDYLNKPEINIITVEDPVEIRMSGISQVEVGGHTTFESSLRTMLRQDPDIVLIGEIRDKDSAEIAIEAGQTGHLVLTTVHTIDAIEAITRIRKLGISDYDISATLVTTISQRLVRRLCPKCKQATQLSEDDLAFISRVEKRTGEHFDIENAQPYKPVGCPYCDQTGYYDRIAIFEVLCINDYIKDMIAEGKSILEIKEYAMQNTDYAPVVVDGVHKVLSGVTTISELKKKITI